MWVHHQENPEKNVGAPEFWCPGTRTLVPPMFLTVSDLQTRHCNNRKTLPAQMWVHHQEIPQKNEGAPEFWCPGTRTLVPFPAENRFFVLISRMGIRNINFSFFLSVFICSWHFLVLLEHCQHKFENTIKKTPKKNVGAPEFWCPGTRTLVPPMFLTVTFTFSWQNWSLSLQSMENYLCLQPSIMSSVFLPTTTAKNQQPAGHICYFCKYLLRSRISNRKSKNRKDIPGVFPLFFCFYMLFRYGPWS